MGLFDSRRHLQNDYGPNLHVACILHYKYSLIENPQRNLVCPFATVFLSTLGHFSNLVIRLICFPIDILC